MALGLRERVDSSTIVDRQGVPAPPIARTGGAELSLQGLGKAFGENRVLSDVTLSVPAGQFVAVIGRSGCGKSTLLRLVAGLETPTEGRTLVEGQPLVGLNRRSRMMFQDARLLPWKRVRENVALGLQGVPVGERTARAQAALAQVGLPDRGGDWPLILSGGQKQRVALARALATEPPLLLLDEPLGALDALTRLEMQALIESVWQSRCFTALLVTHDVEEAVALADRVILLSGGEVSLDLPIDLPRSRPRGSAEFAALKQYVLDRVLAAKERGTP